MTTNFSRRPIALSVYFPPFRSLRQVIVASISDAASLAAAEAAADSQH